MTTVPAATSLSREVRLSCNLTRMPSAQLSSTEVLVRIVDSFLMWETYVAHLEAKPPVSKEVKHCRDILEKTTRFLPAQGRYEAGVLWADEEPNLPDHWQGVLEWYRRMMKRLEKRHGHLRCSRERDEG